MKQTAILLILALNVGMCDKAVAATDSSYTGVTNTVPAKPEATAPKVSVPKRIPSEETNTISVGIVPPVTSERVATLETSDLKEYADLTPAIQALISHGLELTRLNLKYQYGSDDPKNGGMDCSGTVYYLLEQAGLKDVPRDASGLYRWVWKSGHVETVVSAHSDTFELDRLKPGDLLFWIGTYDVDHDPPVSHVMIYLGTNRQNGQRVMLGASEGRQFDGKPRYGVSVFDFKLRGTLRKEDAAAASSREADERFIGYGPVPGL